jgi:transposase
MERIVERPGALDVHEASVTACVRVWGGRVLTEEVAEFKTTVSRLLALRDWLEALGVSQVAMEATGVYWKPVWAVLEDSFALTLVNARHVKAVALVQHCVSSRMVFSNSPVCSGLTWIRRPFRLPLWT